MKKKRTHSNRTNALYKPQSPVGEMKNKKGGVSNLGLSDPSQPSWREAPYNKPFIVPMRFGS